MKLTLVRVTTFFAATAAFIADASALPVAGLYPTGVDNNGNVVGDALPDPHWRIFSTTDPALVVGDPMYVCDEAGLAAEWGSPLIGGPWIANQATGKWLCARPKLSTMAVADVVFEFKVDLTGYLPATASVAFDIAADNTYAVLVNGTPGVSGAGFSSLQSHTINAGFVNGVNTLRFVMTNQGGPAGILVPKIQLAADADGTDPDADGLTNYQEHLLGTDPTKADSDGDGLSDGAEVGTNGVFDVGVDTNPLDADTDDDGLSDGDEKNGTGPNAGKATNPLLVDTDGDGVHDKDETTLGTDPTKVDSDGDGIGDNIEASVSGTTGPFTKVDSDGDGTIDALDTDSDGDTLLDSVERGSGATPRDSDGDGKADFRDADDDNDGILTKQEITDAVKLTGDVDMDGKLNWLDTDSDGDGKLDKDEPTDANGNGTVDYLEVAPGAGAADSGTSGSSGGLDGGADAGAIRQSDSDAGVVDEASLEGGGCNTAALPSGWGLFLLALTFVGLRRRA